MIPLLLVITHRNTRRVHCRRQRPTTLAKAFRAAVRAPAKPVVEPSPAPAPEAEPPAGAATPKFRSLKHRDTSDVVAWAKRINRGWFVRNGLADTAAAWLAQLEELDPARLLASCDIARALSRGPDRTNDPKPWFYAGLFSLATEAEARQFLANYRLTSAAVPALAADEATARWVAGMTSVTRELIDRLRVAVQAEVAKLRFETSKPV